MTQKSKRNFFTVHSSFKENKSDKIDEFHLLLNLRTLIEKLDRNNDKNSIIKK